MQQANETFDEPTQTFKDILSAHVYMGVFLLSVSLSVCEETERNCHSFCNGELSEQIE